MLLTKERHDAKEYYSLISYIENAPPIQNLIESFTKNSCNKKFLPFVEHVTLNPEGANWKFYHFQLNKFSYKSFLFAFGYEAWHFSGNDISVKQFEKNAKRLSRKLSKMSIRLSKTEKQLLAFCSNYSVFYWNTTFTQRIEQAEALYLLLILEYLC